MKDARRPGGQLRKHEKGVNLLPLPPQLANSFQFMLKCC